VGVVTECAGLVVVVVVEVVMQRIMIVAVG